MTITRTGPGGDPAAAAAALLGAALAGRERLHGGDLSEVIRIRLGSGDTAIVKAGGTAQAEAAMLRAIRAAGVPAPEVLAVGADVLVLEDLGADEGPGNAWASLAAALKQLHSATGPTYGWEADYRFGPVAIRNAPAADWPAFWAERRLLPFVRHVPPDLARRIERACGRLGECLPERPAPALLHGDLWVGNIMARGGRVTGLIDPACYYGDPEVDVAMLCLFGRPGRAFWEAYGLAGSEGGVRRDIYQLWPALVHLRLFGAGYRGLVERCLEWAA